MADAQEVIEVGSTPASTLIRRVVAVVAAFAIVTGALVANAGEFRSAGGPVPRTAGIRNALVPTPEGSTQPDIVLILTDDQRFDTLWAMPIVRGRLAARGIEFTNAFVSNPICCPSRASILTGTYSHTNGVYTNHQNQPFGGFPAFDDRSSVATWLQDAGYRTALMGKYLNGYGSTYVPPGWDRWFTTWDDGAYFDYSANEDGALRRFGTQPQDYGTDLLARQATGFIRSTDPGRPLFLYFATHAAHGPATAAPRDRDAFAHLAPWRPASYDEADMSDKPAHLRRGPMSTATRTTIDRFRRDQYRSLLAVDRAVARILDALRATDRLRNTLVVFTSDNGMLWGEHRWNTKGVPYEESIRVPFVVRFDALIDRPSRDERMVLNIDLAPTFVELAGATAGLQMEGVSLVPLLERERVAWRTDFLMEHLELEGHGVPTYCGVRSVRFSYVAYGTGEEELYDLGTDPAQLRNVVGNPRYTEVVQHLRGRLRALCRPVPPGYGFSVTAG
jgi:arylsulfatase A-like enzyme